jgi:Holliday junction resolvase YEN1
MGPLFTASQTLIYFSNRTINFGTITQPGSDEAAIYTADAIENVDAVGLTRGGLLLIALMAGGDYDEGLAGCGPSIAYGLAKAGLGDTLLTALDTLGRADLEAFLPGWREQVRYELLTNSSQCLAHRHPTLALHLTAAFPDMEVLDCYQHPITSRNTFSSDVNAAVTALMESWKPREPVINNIARFCKDHFGWKDAGTLLKKFQKALWPGVLVRMFCTVSHPLSCITRPMY